MNPGLGLTAYLIVAVAGASLTPTEDSAVLNLTFSKYKDNGRENSEQIVGFDGAIGLQQTTTQDGYSLRLHEITNGSLIVQLIFFPSNQLSDCDVSNSKHQIRRLLKHIRVKHTRFKSIEKPIDIERVARMTSMVGWIDRCNAFHARELGLDSSDGSEGDTIDLVIAENVNSVRVSRSKVKSRLLIGGNKLQGDSKRKKRGLMDLMYPGTKWCGKGNSANNFQDLGENKHTDKCCRAHDYCSQIIPAMSSGYNYFNFGLLTMSSCKCDNRFKNCLHRAAGKHNDTLADMIGHIYFNVIGMTCFNVEERDYCTEASFWGHCFKTERLEMAIFDQVMTY